MQNLIIMEFVGIIQPFESMVMNFKELVNELFILILTTVLFAFTDFVPDQETKYNVAGWGYCLILSMCIIFNFFYIFRDMYNILRLRVIKYYKRFKHKFDAAKKEL